MYIQWEGIAWSPSGVHVTFWYFNTVFVSPINNQLDKIQATQTLNINGDNNDGKKKTKKKKKADENSWTIIENFSFKSSRMLINTRGENSETADMLPWQLVPLIIY